MLCKDALKKYGQLSSKSVSVKNISKCFFQKFERNFLKEQLSQRTFLRILNGIFDTKLSDSVIYHSNVKLKTQ